MKHACSVAMSRLRKELRLFCIKKRGFITKAQNVYLLHFSSVQIIIDSKSVGVRGRTPGFLKRYYYFQTAIFSNDAVVSTQILSYSDRHTNSVKGRSTIKSVRSLILRRCNLLLIHLVLSLVLVLTCIIWEISSQ